MSERAYFVEIVHQDYTSSFEWIVCKREDLDKEVAKFDEYYIECNIHKVI